MPRALIRARGPLILVVVALAFLVVRGVVDKNFRDFTVPYLQARAWLFGGNPYDWAALNAVKIGELPRPPGGWTDWLVYPPSSFALLAPIGALPWDLAWPTWLSLSLLVYVAMAVAVGRWTNAFATPERTLIFFAGVLAMFGLHTGIAHGQPSIPAGSLLLLAFYVEAVKGRPAAAGALAALSLCLKPHIGGAALAYFLLRRRWRAFAWTCALGTLIAGVAILPLTINHHAWLSGYLELNLQMFGFGGSAPRGAPDLTIVDLNAILRYMPLVEGSLWPARMTMALVLLALWLFVFAGDSRRGDDLLALPPFMCLILLASYHRVYDLILLVPLFGWVIGAWSSVPRWRTLPPAVALAPLMQPVPTATVIGLWYFRASDPAPDGPPNFAYVILLSHLTWILLFLFVFLCVAAWHERRSMPKAAPQLQES